MSTVCGGLRHGSDHGVAPDLLAPGSADGHPGGEPP
jgi:hypothetical protein